MIFKNEIKNQNYHIFVHSITANQFSAHSREEKQSKHEMLRLFVCLAASLLRALTGFTEWQRAEKNILPQYISPTFLILFVVLHLKRKK